MPKAKKDIESASDSNKLRLLADWFDLPSIQAKHPNWSNLDTVQQDLRRIADRLERKGIFRCLADYVLNLRRR